VGYKARLFTLIETGWYHRSS